MMEKEKSTFLSPDYPCIIVSKLTAPENINN